ncbi:MAG: ATP-grasp domain-containing protein [Lachnospiraceae bacterium]|nr:ATP-grasp domain-containing protein [Lachnospiraceae bacterium]
MGLKVTALDGDANAPGLKYADSSFVVDIRDNNKLAAILDEHRPDIILPVPIGRYLISTGAMNDRYGLKGVSYKAADLCTDKYAFHNCLSAAGLRTGTTVLLKAGECEADTASLTFPVVAKPRYGSGSRGVEIFPDAGSLKSDFLSSAPFDEDYILETCISGSEYGVDGIYINGSFKPVLLREKLITPPPYRQCVAYYSVGGPSAFKDKLLNFLQAVGNALGLTDCVMHADIIRTAEDEPFVIELSPRPSGHNLHNLFTPLASGVDEVDAFIRYVLGMPCSFIPEEKAAAMIGYFDMSGKVISVPDEGYLRSKYPLLDYCCNIKAGDGLCGVTDGHSLMGRGYYILKASDRPKLDEYSKALKAEFEVTG